MRYIFDSSHQVDWRERLGYLLLTPYFSTKGYYKVLGVDKQEVAKTNSTAMRILNYVFQTLQIKRLGKYLIKSSDSFKARFSDFQIQIQPYTNKANPLYYTPAERWSFLDSALTVYTTTINSEEAAWQTPEASKFLRDELSRIKSDTRALIAQTDIQINNTPQDQSLLDLEDRLDELEERCDAYLAVLDNRIGYEEISDLSNTKEVLGVSNAGNTCYINAAVQPLLAIKDFPDLVPPYILQKMGESIHDFNGRKDILDSFKAFIDAYNAKKSPSELGKLIAQLRTRFFKADLVQGGFSNPDLETSMQDVGSFFELILYVIEKNFQLTHTKKFKVPDDHPDYQVSETLPQGTLFLKDKNGSIQDKICSFALENNDSLSKGTALRTKIEENIYTLTDFTETMRIASPPDLLVFRVEEYKVNSEADKTINCAPLFENQNDGTVLYELAGFAQNKSQVHWTSVVLDKGTWKFCNDDQVREVTPQDAAFIFPANYMIYRKKTASNQAQALLT